MVRQTNILQITSIKSNKLTMKQKLEQQRAEEFTKLIGQGKTIYECEMDNDLIDEVCR